MVELLLALLLQLNIGGATNKNADASLVSPMTTSSSAPTDSSNGTVGGGDGDILPGDPEIDGGSGTWDTKN